jgi:hypothetical protein
MLSICDQQHVVWAPSGRLLRTTVAYGDMYSINSPPSQGCRSSTIKCPLVDVDIQWTFSEHSVKNTQWRTLVVNIQWTLSEHSVNIQWTFSEHSVNIQWTFSEHYSTRGLDLAPASQRLMPNYFDELVEHNTTATLLSSVYCWTVYHWTSLTIAVLTLYDNVCSNILLLYGMQNNNPCIYDSNIYNWNWIAASRYMMNLPRTGCKSLWGTNRMEAAGNIPHVWPIWWQLLGIYLTCDQ